MYVYNYVCVCKCVHGSPRNPALYMCTSMCARACVFQISGRILADGQAVVDRAVHMHTIPAGRKHDELESLVIKAVSSISMPKCACPSHETRLSVGARDVIQAYSKCCALDLHICM